VSANTAPVNKYIVPLIVALGIVFTLNIILFVVVSFVVSISLCKDLIELSYVIISKEFDVIVLFITDAVYTPDDNVQSVVAIEKEIGVTEEPDEPTVPHVPSPLRNFPSSPADGAGIKPAVPAALEVAPVIAVIPSIFLMAVFALSVYVPTALDEADYVESPAALANP
jgi:hypothetical protein